MKNTIKLIASFIICYSPAFLGTLLTDFSQGDWYRSLPKPSFMPPGWLFGPVWTVLYAMMAVSLFLIWKQGWSDPKVKTAGICFLIQLALNAAWSPVFFGLKMPALALAVIVLLWLAILLTILKFAKVARLPAYLLIPYLAWVSFATILNTAIVYLSSK